MEKVKVLITGATGNIGQEVVRTLSEKQHHLEVVAAVRNVVKAQESFSEFPRLQYRKFDFEDSSGFNDAFQDIDLLFLLRPPQISEVDTYFKPLLEAAQNGGIRKVVFLSVQGAEKSKVIPHNKIEELISKAGLEYVFIRPSYFMQNLTTTLLPEIREKRSITLPAGKAKFNWIDVVDIGEAVAEVLIHFDKRDKNVFVITGSENKNFKEVCPLISEITGENVKYRSVNPVRFFLKKKREGMKSAFVLVMTMLHFIPRLQSEPEITGDFKTLTGKHPASLKQFLDRERTAFLKPAQ